MSLTIVSADKKGETLYLTVQGSSVTEVTSPAARKFAYEKRGDYGFDSSGIEASGGPYPVDTTLKDENDLKGKPIEHDKMAEISSRVADLAYRHVYRLTRMI